MADPERLAAWRWATNEAEFVRKGVSTPEHDRLRREGWAGRLEMLQAELKQRAYEPPSKGQVS